jgi:hypothetical protein
LFIGAGKMYHAMDKQISKQAEIGMAIDEAVYDNDVGKLAAKQAKKSAKRVPAMMKKKL